MQKTKILFGLAAFIALLLLMNIIAAQETETAEVEMPAEATAIAETEAAQLPETTTTPDKPLVWSINRALERINLALTLGKAAKARKGLVNARDRLLAVRQMIKAGKLEQAAKALAAYKVALERAKKVIAEIKETEPEKELEEQLVLEQELTNQEEEIEKIDTEIEVKVKKGLTEEQQEKIENILEALRNRMTEARDDMERAMSNTKIKIKTVKAKTDEEIEKLVEEKKEKLNITLGMQRMADKAIERTEKIITIVNERITKAEEANITRNLTLAREIAERASSLLEEAKEARENESYNEAIVLANKAKALVMRYVHARLEFDKKGIERAKQVLKETAERWRKLKGAEAAVEDKISKLNAVVSRLENVKQRIETRGEKAEDAWKEAKKEIQCPLLMPASAEAIANCEAKSGKIVTKKNLAGCEIQKCVVPLTKRAIR